NYPNPFNPATTISYNIPVRTNVILKVYDVMGAEVKTLVNKEQPAGTYNVNFDATDLTSGVYFYKLHARSYVKTMKMILLR
ncbi:MAG TPA: T9SS type A sorting domain-containing protein, partial [Ignavibacteriales bacterium]|nr:T9SS type A sorting domain-containing protein [Ignavibacteriales bacterium]